MKKNNEAFLKQSRTRVRSNLKLVLFCLVLLAAAIFLRVPGVFIWIAFSLSCFFGCLAAIEFFNVWMLKKNAAEVSVDAAAKFGAQDDYPVNQGGDDTFLEERVFVEKVGEIKIRLLASTRNAAHIEHVLKRLPEILDELRDFLKKECAADRSKSEILKLEIDTFEFFDRNRPDIAEIVFEEASDGKIWACVYKNGEFSNLGFDG